MTTFDMRESNHNIARLLLHKLLILRWGQHMPLSKLTESVRQMLPPKSFLSIGKISALQKPLTEVELAQIGDMGRYRKQEFTAGRAVDTFHACQNSNDIIVYYSLRETSVATKIRRGYVGTDGRQSDDLGVALNFLPHSGLRQLLHLVFFTPTS